MSKEKTRGFRLPMHLAVSKDLLRPAMMGVYFKDEYMYATDAHILVKAKISEFTDFEQSEIDILNGKLIDHEIFKILFKTPFLQVREDGFLDPNKNILYLFKDLDLTYPNVDAVIPKDGEKSENPNVEDIGVNPIYLKKLYDVMGHPNATHMLKLSFNTASKAILVENTGYSTTDLVGILMPEILT